ncbi:MAG TPA: hypothetical protein VGM51_13470 [Armatimonadota bacterium]
MMIFEETQRFRQPWLWLMMVILVVVEIGPFGSGLYRQLVWRHTFDINPASDRAFIWTSIAVFLVLGAVIWLLLAAYLRVEVRDDALFVRFFPFIRGRVIPYSEIRACAARRYSPIAEYGGWGVRFGRNGKAYNVSGNRGVQLELVSGERLLLGSQHADEMAAAIARNRHE